MIARMWHGAVPGAKKEEYLNRMRKVALPDYRSISGNRGAFCLCRMEGDIAHIERTLDTRLVRRQVSPDVAREQNQSATVVVIPYTTPHPQRHVRSFGPRRKAGGSRVQRGSESASAICAITGAQRL